MEMVAYLLAVLVITFAMIVGHVLFWRWYYTRQRTPDERHFITTEDGWRIALARYRPSAAGPAEGEPVICCPGVACNSRLFDFQDDISLARYLAAKGFDVWLLDLRGTGSSQRPDWFGPGWGYGFGEYATQDAMAALTHVTQITGHARVQWIGHSMGGLIGYHAAMRGGPGAHIAGVVALGSPADFSGHREALGRWHSTILDKFLRGWPVVRLGRLCTAVAPIAGWLRVYPEMLFVSARNTPGRTLRHFMVEVVEDVPRQLLDEFADNILRTRGFTGRPVADEAQDYARCTVPVMAVAGRLDRVAPPSSVQAITQMIGSADAMEWIAEHDDGVGFGHLDLVVGERAPQVIYPRVADWLLERRLTRATSASSAPAETAAESADAES